MRLVFLGYQTWGCVALEALLAAGHEVPLVITHPYSDGPYETIWSDSVAELAAARGIPCVERIYANDAEAGRLIRECDAELIVSSDWRTWLSPRIYSLVRHGAINVHDALLPRYGGFAPLNWALLNGEPEVGVTVHFMNEEFDLGDIVLQRRVPVADGDTATTLFHKTLPLFGELTVEAVGRIADGSVVRTPQDPERATFFHKRSERDSLIDWMFDPEFICRLVLAQSLPYPPAFTYHNGRKLQIHAASLSRRRYGGTPGRIFCRAEGGVVVVAGPSAPRGLNQGVVLQEVSLAEGGPIKAVDYFEKMGGYLTSNASTGSEFWI